MPLNPPAEISLAAPNILVVGDSCSGKTTLAAALAERFGLRHIEIDALSWAPGWTEVPRDRLRQLVREAIAEPGWAMDGNYQSSLGDLTLAAAGTIVWLDLPLHVTLRRTVARSWRRWRRSELLWGHSRERFWPHLLPWDQSLIWWTLKSHRRRRRRYAQAMADSRWAHIRFVRLRSSAAVERWFAQARLAEPDGDAR